MRRNYLNWASITIALMALAAVLNGCVCPEGYEDWRWRQLNPTYRPLPGEMDR